MAESITLIVEDDRVNRTALLRLFRASGITAESAVNVAEAIQKIDHLRPAAVVLDLHLPDGLGTQVLSHIRTMLNPPRVCVLTGSATDDAMAQVLELQPDQVMLKPVHPDPLLQWVHGAKARP